mgnify:CR=1 FL=1
MYNDEGTEAEHLSEIEDTVHFEGEDDLYPRRRARRSNYAGGDRKQKNRYRCCTVGCNPKLFGEDAAALHTEKTGHRTAKWPVRSAEGRRKARLRNSSGYYDKYNVGEKDALIRNIR